MTKTQFYSTLRDMNKENHIHDESIWVFEASKSKLKLEGWFGTNTVKRHSRA